MRLLTAKRVDKDAETILFEQLTLFGQAAEQQVLQTFVQNALKNTLREGDTERACHLLELIKSAMLAQEQGNDALERAVANLCIEASWDEDDKIHDALLDLVPRLSRETIECLLQSDTTQAVSTFISLSDIK